MFTGELVSICIPTYKRPDLLRRALESCLAQEHRPLEILVGDDSPSDEAGAYIRELSRDSQVVFRYRLNRPSLGQASNVNRLFLEASGDKLMLLHDDDLLMPKAVQRLLACWEQQPNLTAAFGKQYIINHDGHVLQKQSEELNRYFYRTQAYAGTALRPIESALVQQFPNDGYMVKAAAARKVLYRTRELVGEVCDFDFGIRLAAAAEQQCDGFCFVDEFTAEYRVTNEALTRHLLPAARMFEILEKLSIARECAWASAIALERLAPLALMGHAMKGERREALHIFFSVSYPWRRRLSPGGLKSLMAIALPVLF